MSEKLWGGRFEVDSDELAEMYTSSLADDVHLFEADIEASIAHLHALKTQKLVKATEAKQLEKTLKRLRKEFQDGTFELNPSLEDIHMNIEAYLIEKLGDIGKKIHTGRSRNDQVITAFKLTLRKESQEIQSSLVTFCETLIENAERFIDAIIPGYTHLQKAQPIRLGHYYLALFEMFFRDLRKLKLFAEFLNELPLGVGALAGQPFGLDRFDVAKELGFTEPTRNSLDTVADRDFVLDQLYVYLLIMVHLSRLSEDIVLWCSDEFGFIQLSDAFTTGSSIMPQKKNPDISELTRGKVGRVVGSLMSMITTLKGLPMGYNRDLQEDKHALFEALVTVKQSLAVNSDMLKTIKVNQGIINRHANQGYLLATDLADYLVKKGVPFREAHGIVGRLVGDAVKLNKGLKDLSLNEFQQHSNKFEADILTYINITHSVDTRDSYGGTAKAQVEKQLKEARKRLEEEKSV